MYNFGARILSLDKGSIQVVFATIKIYQNSVLLATSPVLRITTPSAAKNVNLSGLLENENFAYENKISVWSFPQNWHPQKEGGGDGEDLFPLTLNTYNTLWAHPDVLSSPVERYHQWTRIDGSPTYINHDEFFVDLATTAISTHYRSFVTNAAIQTELIDGGTGGNVEFRDPWLIDYNDPAYGNSPRNRGQSGALWHSQTSPFSPNSGTGYEGVFLNQVVEPGKPYYSARVSQSQSINGFTWYFQNWTGSGANPTQPNSLETPVVFTSSSNPTVKAHYKANRGSGSATTTATNSQRKLVKGAGANEYHLTYESTGEVWYTKTSDGSSWTQEQRLSAGSAGNAYPSIAHFNGKLYVVWQYKVGNNYDIYFTTSQDGGSNWGTPYVLASTQPSDEPLPVIQTGVTSNFSMMVVYPSSDGAGKLKALRTTNSNPTSSGAWTSADIPGTGANDFWPSLASAKNYWGNDANFGVAFARTSGDVHYRYYRGADSTWSSSQFNLSSIVPGSNYTHKTPSLTSTGTGTTQLHVAWYRVYGSGSSRYNHSIIYRKSNGFDSWPNEYYVVYYEGIRRPSLTCVGYNDVDLLLQYYNNNTIYKMHFNGYSWTSSPIFVGSGQYPSVSIGSSSAKYVYTGASGPPYSIELSSETFSKPVSAEPYYERAISWLDSSGAHLTLQIKGLRVKTSNGELQGLAFQAVSLDSTAFTSGNAWDYMASKPALLPADAESLVVDYTLTGENIEKVAAASTGDAHVTLELRNGAEQSLGSLSGLSLPASGNLSETRQRLAIPLNSVPQQLRTTNLKVALKVSGLNPKSTTFASLGHIYDFTKQLKKNRLAQENVEKSITPGQFMLFGNYPNPFNPETTIKYQVPDISEVTLEIYDLLGRPIRILVNEVQEGGVYEIRWDGKNALGQSVASGIYLYRLQAGNEISTRKLTFLK